MYYRYLEIMWGDIVMKQEAGNINLNDLRLEVERKLLEYNLISFNDKISLCPIHNVIIHGKYFSHYIITCVEAVKNSVSMGKNLF